MDKIPSQASVTSPGQSSLFWLLSDSWIMAKRSIMHIIRSLDQLLSVALFPIMFLILNRYVFGGAIDTGNISYVNFLVAGILVQMLAFGANYTTINLAVDLQKGIVDRLRSLPMASSALLVGHVASDLLRNIMSAIIVFAVSFLIGFRSTATVTDWLLVILLSLLFTLAISWLSAILGLFVKSLEAAQWVGFVVIFPLTFASSAFVPTDTMPGALRFFAENQPLTHVINAMRSWLVGTPSGNSAWLAFAWCIATIVIAAPLATWIFKRKGTK
ncbi:ABC transporter permease [Compostibacter hankyongensis]|uniref:Transport permease protein n=1 Tax=Compostibacter hankyongensis TaxID=1007089 RepID=A0ABP8FMF7_9BACT